MPFCYFLFFWGVSSVPPLARENNINTEERPSKRRVVRKKNGADQRQAPPGLTGEADTLIRVTAFSKDLPAFEKTESKSSPPPWEGSNKGISNFTASKIFLKLCISVTMYHSSFIFSIFSFNVHRIYMPCRRHGPHTALCSAPVVQPDVLQRCIGPTDPVSACVSSCLRRGMGTVV